MLIRGHSLARARGVDKIAAGWRRDPNKQCSLHGHEFKWNAFYVGPPIQSLADGDRLEQTTKDQAPANASQQARKRAWTR